MKIIGMKLSAILEFLRKIHVLLFMIEGCLFLAGNVAVEFFDIYVPILGPTTGFNAGVR